MDIQIQKLIKLEKKRQAETINLIASENYVSADVLAALGSVLTNKYSEGYPGRRFYGGNEVIDNVENLCKERALKLFKLNPDKWHTNVQPYSGSPANLAVYSALVPLGGKIMGMKLDMGGHLTHGHGVSFTGKAWKQIPYGLNKKELLDYDEVRKIAKQNKPKLIIAGFTAYSRKINFKKFREIADKVGAYLLIDMSHIAGLIAGNAYPSPFKYADIVTSTAHKTLRGPRGAMIFCKKEFAQAIDRAVFPGLQGGPHNHQTAAIAIALKEAMLPSFQKYSRQVILNAQMLAKELKNKGWRIISGGTDSHLFIVDTWEKGITGKDAEKMLERAGIVANKNTIPHDTRSPFNPSGIRLGTSAVTTRGMKEREMKIIAGWVDDILLKKSFVARIKKEAIKLCNKFPIPE